MISIFWFQSLWPVVDKHPKIAPTWSNPQQLLRRILAPMNYAQSVHQYAEWDWTLPWVAIISLNSNLASFLSLLFRVSVLLVRTSWRTWKLLAVPLVIVSQTPFLWPPMDYQAHQSSAESTVANTVNQRFISINSAGNPSSKHFHFSLCRCQQQGVQQGLVLL